MCPPHQRFNLAQCKKYATESADQSLEAGRTCCQIVLIIGILFYHPGLEEMYCFWGVIKSIRFFLVKVEARVMVRVLVLILFTYLFVFCLL